MLPKTGSARRIGITGVPGAGKSTTIESLGLWLIEQGHQVAVLVIDPSSARTGGTILGDKTRMQGSAEPGRVHPAFALGRRARRRRPEDPRGDAALRGRRLRRDPGRVGRRRAVRGRARRARRLLCLLLVPGAGDELQGIKRGIMELADLIVVNKADGDRDPARQARPRRLPPRAAHAAAGDPRLGDAGADRLGHREDRPRRALGDARGPPRPARRVRACSRSAASGSSSAG